MPESRSFVVHPFIFAAIPVIASADHAKLALLPEESIAAAVTLQLFTLLVFACLWLLLKDARKSGLVTSLIVILIFTFSQFQSGLNFVTQSCIHQDLSAWAVLLIFSLTVLGIAMAVLKQNWNFRNKTISVDSHRLNTSLNAVSIVLLLLNGLPLLSFQLKDAQLQQKVVSTFHANYADTPLSPKAGANKPDIYYIILDACANQRTLKSIWGYDNQDFMSFLKSNGFYVVPKPFSNYDCTNYSLSSSLNMQYLDRLADLHSRQPLLETVYARLIKDNSLVYLLKRLGYRFINFSSGTVDIPNADANVRCNFVNNFGLYLALLTPLAATENYVPLLRDMLADMMVYPDRRLHDVIAMHSPKFVFLHCNLPHPPFIFDKDGKRLPLNLVSNTRYSMPELYLGQVKFAESEARKWIEMILAQSQTSPIIILQADHGPLFPIAPESAYYNERMRILNAIYFPGTGNRGLYDSISPVNTFRVLLNDYFNAQLPILPDRSFYEKRNPPNAYWEDVTDQLKFE